MAEKGHPGITMHKLSFGGGFMGLLFAAGSALIFVLGFPTLGYFVALAIGLGVGVAATLRIFAWRGSNGSNSLSLLSVSEPATSRETSERIKWQKSFRTRPAITPA